jgi:hypothetical protein
MTETVEAESPPPPSRRTGRGRRSLGRSLGLILGVVLVVVLMLLALLYLNRRAAARQVLIGWLERQGVEADMKVERVEVDGLTASIRIGDPANPDVVVEQVEVDYAIGAPWSKGGLGVTPSRIRLLRPVVRASFRDGKLSLGSLDPLIEQFTGQPPRPDSRGPLVLVEGGRLRLDTDYGPVAVLADARVDDGKLMQLNARLPEANLRSGDISANGLRAAMQLTTTGDRVALRASASADAASMTGLNGGGAAITLTGDLPYPDMKARRGDGRVQFNAVLAAEQLQSGQSEGRDLAARLDFNGQVAGWIETFRIEGALRGRTGASRIAVGDASATAAQVTTSEGRVVLTRDAQDFSWRFDGPVALTAARAAGAGLDGRDVRVESRALTVGGRGSAVEAQGPLALNAAVLGWDEMTLRGVNGAANLDMISDQGFRLLANGGLRSSAASWPLFGPAASDDVAELAEMKRALGDFSLEAPSLTVAVSSSSSRVVLNRAAVIRPRYGGVLTLTPAQTPIFSARDGQAGGGALSLTATRGEGLPEAAFAIPAWRLTPSGFTATLDGRAGLDFDLARGIEVQTRGELASSNGRLTYVAADCSALTVERLEMDDSDVTDIAGQICPTNKPLVTVMDGGWRAEGGVTGLHASAPFLAMGFTDVVGGFTATGGPAGVGLEATVASAAVVDTTAPTRFHPLTASGAARLADENWSGAFDLARQGHAVGRMTLAHDGRTGSGGLDIDAPSIAFTQAGLQPDDLSPLVADFIQSPVEGSVGFEGRIDWLKDAEGTSSGRLTIPGLDFTSPAGPVKGLHGVVELTSLVPLVTAPNQRLTVDRLESVAAITDIALTFGLDKSAFLVDGGELNIAGGVVRVEPFTVPLDLAQGFSGVIILERVQLGEVVANSGFADKVSMDAVVSGRLPYTYDPVRGVRVSGGTLEAVQPGKLSISREVLTGVETGEVGEGVPPNTVQDLAYQAMEHLAFDILSAQVNSLDEGRVGVIFRIKGQHQPPQHQELRVTVPDLVSREFLNHPIPLPSGTGIDLTLDTTLNANQLVGDLLQINRSRNGEVVAPSEPEPEPVAQPAPDVPATP